MSQHHKTTNAVNLERASSSHSRGVSDPPTPRPSRLRRLWRQFGAYVEAMEMSYDEIQDARIAALETEVASLRMKS